MGNADADPKKRQQYGQILESLSLTQCPQTRGPFPTPGGDLLAWGSENHNSHKCGHALSFLSVLDLRFDPSELYKKLDLLTVLESIGSVIPKEHVKKERVGEFSRALLDAMPSDEEPIPIPNVDVVA